MKDTGAPKRRRPVMSYPAMGTHQQGGRMEQACHRQAENDRNGDKDVFVLGHVGNMPALSSKLKPNPSPSPSPKRERANRIV